MTILTTFVGRIGKDAVTRFSTGGDPIVGFSLAGNSGFGERKVTLWFDVSGFGRRYETVAPYLLKGAQVWVTGEQGEREHEGKFYKTLRLFDLQLVGKKEGGEQSSQRQPRGPQSAPAPHSAPADNFDDQEIPF